MKYRLVLLLGMAIGYVLGAKAGRGRYEQIARAWESLRRTEGAQQFSAEVSHAASKAGETLGAKANEGVAKVSDMVRHDRERDDREISVADSEERGPTTTPYGANTSSGGAPYGAPPVIG